MLQRSLVVFLTIAVVALAATTPAPTADVCRAPPRIRDARLSRHRFAAAEEEPAALGARVVGRYGAAPNITRVVGGGCKTDDGHLCDVCCNGKCCEVVERSYQRSPAAAELWVPLHIIVIQSKAARTAYPITNLELLTQVEALNTHFATSGVKMHFVLHSVAVHTESELVDNCNTDPCYDSDDCYFYRVLLPRLALDPSAFVNVVICDLPYLGEAQWAWATEEADPRQYIQISDRSLPQRSAGSQGKTLVHEMGHFFGLLHTFEREDLCDVSGDYVDDTPRSSRAAVRTAPCGYAVDSCPDVAGADPITNFMNYEADACMTEFTAGQVERMWRTLSKYRPVLQERYLVAGHCAPNATNLTQCSCDNVTHDPVQWCGGAGVEGFRRFVASGDDSPSSAAPRGAGSALIALLLFVSVGLAHRVL